MPATSNTKSIDFRPSTLTPLQNKAIKWIAGMRWAIAKVEKARRNNSIHGRNAWRLPAKELQRGMVLITRRGSRYSIVEINPYGDRLAVKGCSNTRCFTFYFSPDENVAVEGLNA